MMNYDSVSTVVGRIKEDLEHDFRLKNVAMEGNIIGLKRASKIGRASCRERVCLYV